MRIGFVINDLFNETEPSTTLRLAMTAQNRGHEVWLIGVGDFAYDPDEKVHAHARKARGEHYETPTTYYADLCSKNGIARRITVDDLDILMLRNDPSADFEKAWAQHAAIVFGRKAMRHGVVVLNDPDGLAKAVNKMYFQSFPEIVRAKTLITRNSADIKRFYEENGRKIIIKPLMGSGGRNVFMVDAGSAGNMNQIIESVFRDGYAIVQEFLPEAAKGDTRLFLMNGDPLVYRGKIAAFRRVPGKSDIRSNIHAGGHIRPVEVTEEMLRLAEVVKPKIIQDGMFLVGLDIVGDKLLEVNVFSPGGLHSAQVFGGVDFAEAVVVAMEKKVTYMAYYHRNFDNVEMNSL